MTKKIALSHVYFGWWTVLALGIVAMLGAFASTGFSAFFKPIAADLGLSRAVTSIAPGVIGLGQSVGAIFAGLGSDKYGPKRIILFGIACLVLGFIFMSLVHSLWPLLICGLLLGVGIAFGTLTPIVKVIVYWFIKKSSLALSITFTIYSLSGLALLPLTAWLITTYTWRSAAIIVSIIIALVAFPLTWYFVKSHGPEYYGLLPDGEINKREVTKINQTIKVEDYTSKPETPELTLKHTMKTHAFWMLIASVGYIAGLAAPIMTYHCIPFLTDMGVTPVKAATMMAIWLTASIPARLAASFLVDRIKTSDLRFVLGAGYIIQALGVALFLLTKNISMIYVWFVLYGIGIGVATCALLPLIPRYFGRKSYGAIDGMRLFLNAPIVLIGPIYVGWVYDTTKSYMSVFVLFAILLAVTGIIACFMLPPKPSKIARVASDTVAQKP
jgi:MFS family permease